MYSGNHALCHPLATLLVAAAELETDDRCRFVFVGGGAGKTEVDTRIARGAANLLSLPYQPRESLGASLDAADLHVVSMGDAMVGIVHPSKIYGVLALGKPLLFLGPKTSPAAHLVEAHDLGWVAAHGDLGQVRAALTAARSQSAADRSRLAARARACGQDMFDRRRLIAAVCASVTDAAGSSP